MPIEYAKEQVNRLSKRIVIPERISAKLDVSSSSSSRRLVMCLWYGMTDLRYRFSSAFP